MTVLHAYLSLKSDCVDAALNACRTVRAASVLESGCDRYDFFQSPDDATKLVFVEEWSSREALAVHFEQDAFKAFFAAMGEMMAAAPEIRIFEATLGE